MEGSHVVGFPPLTFRPYGLSRRFKWRRWLETVDGRFGRPVTGVWLSHLEGTQIGPAENWASVGTVPLNVSEFGGPVDLSELRLRATHALGSYTEPSLRDPWPSDAAHRSYADHFDSIAMTTSGWMRTHWLVDGQSLEASVYDWAGAWVGVGRVGDLGIAVLAAAAVSQNIEIESVIDATLQYHFDADQFLPMPETLMSSRRAAVRDEDAEVNWPWHPDHHLIQDWGDGRE